MRRIVACIRSEKNISEDAMNKPKVSVCVTAFNHEKYIEKCLKSILSQRTNFDFEVIIHDDASQDGTPAIIREYARRHPSLIVPILQTKNCYSEDGHAPLMNCATMARGQYLAICEGDDYWLDVDKLKIQNKILDENNKATLVVSPGRIEYDGKLINRLHCNHGPALKSLQAQDVLNSIGQFAPTASYFCRKNIIIDALKLFHGAPIGDLFIEIYAGIFGEIIYYPKVFSVYRAQTEFSWSTSMLKDRVRKMLDYVNKMELIISKYNENPNLPRLNWDKKRADMYFGLAVAYLEEGRMNEIPNFIEKSVELQEFSKKQKILYISRHSRIALLILKHMLPITRRLLR